MDLLSVLLSAFVSLLLLFLLCKLMGNKQISQLSMFDYIIGISIGSIAAELATELENPLRPAIAMVVYALVAFFISVLTSRSIRAPPAASTSRRPRPARCRRWPAPSCTPPTSARRSSTSR